MPRDFYTLFVDGVIAEDEMIDKIKASVPSVGKRILAKSADSREVVAATVEAGVRAMAANAAAVVGLARAQYKAEAAVMAATDIRKQRAVSKIEIAERKAQQILEAQQAQAGAAEEVAAPAPEAKP